MTQQELYHHGILGMKWGVRRYQNEDGSLTAAGQKRYGVGKGGGVSDISSRKGIKRRLTDLDNAMIRNNRQAQRAHALHDDKARDQFAENLKKGEQETWKLVAKAIENGYSIEGNQRQKLAISNGEKFVMGLGIAALPISPIAGGATIGILSETDGRLQSGWKYKVKKAKKEAPTARFKYTERNKGERDRAAWAKAEQERKVHERYKDTLPETSLYKHYKKRFR